MPHVLGILEEVCGCEDRIPAAGSCGQAAAVVEAEPGQKSLAAADYCVEV